MKYNPNWYTDLITWLVTSSKDPKQASLTIRMGLLAVVAWIVKSAAFACGFGLTCLDVDVVLLNQIVGWIELIVFYGFTIVGLVGAIYGAVRKIFFTVKKAL